MDYSTDDDERYRAADEPRRNIASAGCVQIRSKLEVSTVSMPHPAPAGCCSVTAKFIAH